MGRCASGLATRLRCAASLTITTMLGCAGASPPPSTAAPPGSARSLAIVEAELDRLVADGATRAAIVVLDPRDGRVLAAAGRGGEGAGEVDRVLDVGSTIKPLAIAAALDAGLDPSRRFDGEGGTWTLDDGTVVRDLHPRESFDARDAIVASSNVGTAKIVDAVGEAPVRAMFEAVGVEALTPGPWPARGAGIGTGTSLRRLAAAYAAFANGGERVEPTADGRGARRRVMSEATAARVLAMLEDAVGDEGTGGAARIDGHRVAGKTGTTRAGAALFAGIAPVEGARYVVAVRIDRPEGGWGGALAAPSFARVAAALLE
ncbi:MAG: serine hydrolase [Sandaracinaceae bacterium]|nr:serine hydrolase [Sandaracinaceae bacterium]